MKKQHAYYTISFLLFFLFSVPLAGAEPTYCIKDLGVIRDINDSFNSFGINRQGQAVGQVSFQYGGFLAGSLDFFSGRSHPGGFKTEAVSIRELSQADVEDMLIFYQGEVFFPPVKSPTPWQKKPTEVQEDHFSHFTSFDINPDGLAFCDDPNVPYQKCHGVIPYAISWLSDAENKHAVFVYDSNHPDDTDLYIQFDPESPYSWMYQKIDDGIIARGSDPEVYLSEIRTVPLSAHKLYESGPLEGSVLNDVLIYLNEIGKLTITDTDGNSLGYIGDDFVSDIPGAYGSVIITKQWVHHVSSGRGYRTFGVQPCSGSGRFLRSCFIADNRRRPSVFQLSELGRDMQPVDHNKNYGNPLMFLFIRTWQQTPLPWREGLGEGAKFFVQQRI